MSLGKAALRDAAMISLLYSTGMRRVELVRLRREDYNDGTLRLVGKGNKVREIDVAKDWRVPVDAWWETLGRHDHAFLSERGVLLERSGVNFVIAKFCKTAGIKSFTPHDLRRNFATELIEAGVDLITVRDLMGHASLDVTAIYDRRGDEAKRRAVEVFNRKILPEKP